MSDHHPTDPRIAPLTERAIGAVGALVRVAELYDPAVAHRAALRGLVADRLAARIDTPVDRSVLIASAALADMDLIVTRPNDPESNREPTRALLGETVLNRLPGLRDVGASVGSSLEWWDGNGFPNGKSGDDIPLGARIAAVTDALIGDPAAGFVPSWDHARRRVAQKAGQSLDPTLCRLVEMLPLESLEAPAIPSAALIDLLEKRRSTGPPPDRSTATTIKAAVELAGKTADLLQLFAETARVAIDADEILVVRTNETDFEDRPFARSIAPHGTPLGAGLFDLLDFSTQAELRAGIALARSSEGSEHVNELLQPVLVGSSCWGAIIALRDPCGDPFEATDEEVLGHIASEAALSINQTEHWAEMERMALRDQLTGLANRHGLYRVLDEIFSRPAIERLDTALIMCDVDGLKVVNDTQGHQAGDRLLMDAASALEAAVRDPERTTVCRIGGDEFCMVIDGGALLTAHDVSDTIERLFERSAGSGAPRSISCGIAFASEDVASRSALLRAADENQYETKRARKASRAVQDDAVSRAARPPQDRRALRD